MRKDYRVVTVLFCSYAECLQYDYFLLHLQYIKNDYSTMPLFSVAYSERLQCSAFASFLVAIIRSVDSKIFLCFIYGVLTVQFYFLVGILPYCCPPFSDSWG
jgi:hypothetical protein